MPLTTSDLDPKDTTLNDMEKYVIVRLRALVEYGYGKLDVSVEGKKVVNCHITRSEDPKRLKELQNT
jgi:hypothetical protein